MLLTATGSAQTTVMLIWIVALFAIMYFMMWRPQKKEQKRVAAMLSAMGGWRCGCYHEWILWCTH